MSTPNTNTYSGLSIVLDKPSRHDTPGNILSGYAGEYFWKQLLKGSYITRHNCEYRTVAQLGAVATSQPTFREDTRVVLALGQDSVDRLTGTHGKYKLMHLRGSPIQLASNGPVIVPTFTPQDVADRKDYGGAVTGEDGAHHESDEDDDEGGDAKEYQQTKRRNWRWWMTRDIEKALGYLKSGYKKPAPDQLVINPGLDSWVRWLATLDGQTVFIDLETNPLRQLTAIGVSNMEEVAFSIPFHGIDNQLVWSTSQIYTIYRALARLFARCTVVGHNSSSFDLVLLATHYGIPLPRRTADTMLMQHRCYPLVEKSLGHCISLYTNHTFHKDEGLYLAHNATQLKQLLTYNAKDVARTAEVYKALQLRLLSTRALDSAIQANESIVPYATATCLGARLDIPTLEHLHASYLARYDQLCRILRLLTGRNLNPRSWKQVDQYYYGNKENPEQDGGLGYKRPSTGSTTGLKVLLKLYGKYGTPSLRVILAARAAGKSASALQFRLWRGDRFTCSWGIGSTDCHRLGSRALFKFGSDKGFGSNFQNWDKALRKCVIADPGKLLGQVDQSGADALIVAYLCRAARYRQLFQCGIKPHVYIAMMIPKFRSYWEEQMGESIERFINCDIGELTKQPRWKELVRIIKATDDDPDTHYYFIGKKTGHSGNYGMAWPTFQLDIMAETDGKIRLTPAEAKEFLDFYKCDLFPEIPEWHEHVQEYLRYESRVLRNLFGYPCEFHPLLDDALFRKAYAYVPASTVATITNRAFTAAQAEITKAWDLHDETSVWHGVDLLQNGHDSILYQAPEDKVEAVGRAIQVFMQPELTAPDGTKFRMGSGLSVGRNWGPYNELTNTEGMKEL